MTYSALALLILIHTYYNHTHLILMPQSGKDNKMDIEQFEALFVNLKNNTCTYGAASAEVMQTIDEMLKITNFELQPEYIAVMRKHGILPEPTPISLALADYNKAAKTYGEDSDEAIAVFMKIMDVDPPEHLAEADKVFKEMFGQFKTIGVTEEGNPLYSLDEVAGKLGISTDEAVNHMFKMEEMTGKKFHHEGELYPIH